MSIGDLTSDAKGTGARFNTGKTPYELIAWLPYGRALQKLAGCGVNSHQQSVAYALMALGRFQAGGSESDLSDVLYHTAYASGLSQVQLAEQTARVLEYGKTKYDEWNWAKGMPWQSVIACAARHLLGTPNVPGMWSDPRGLDPDSGHMHAGHVGCNILFLLQFMENYTEGDDRPKQLDSPPF